MANTSAFQAEDAGSIPVIPSNRTSLWIQRILAPPGSVRGGVFTVLVQFSGSFGVRNTEFFITHGASPPPPMQRSARMLEPKSPTSATVCTGQVTEFGHSPSYVMHMPGHACSSRCAPSWWRLFQHDQTECIKRILVGLPHDQVTGKPRPCLP